MNDMHFKGTITRYHHTFVDDHSPEVIHVWVMIEPKDEVMIEISGTAAELAAQLDLASFDNKLDFENFTGRKCDVIYNAQGYHIAAMA